MAIKWQINWKLTALTLLLIPVLLRLGFWQLERAEQKRALKADYIERATISPLSTDELSSFEQFSTDKIKQLSFRKVRLEGRYVNAFTALLDNQITHSRPGYHVLTLFESRAGIFFWVNRGWVAASPDRALPNIQEALGSVVIEASIYLPQGKPVILAQDNWSESWPVLIQSVDILKLNQRYTGSGDARLFSQQLRLDPGFHGAFSINWPVVNTQPQKHTGYAVQWFAMSIALVACWIYASLKRD